MLRFNAKDNAKAITPLKEAVELDPDFGRAYAALAWALFRDFFYSWSEIMDNGMTQKIIMAQRYLDVAKKYPTSLAHTVEAYLLLWNGRGAEARAEAAQALPWTRTTRKRT